MTDTRKISVLMPIDEADTFDAYCRAMGHKKSTLILRLVREHLKAAGWAASELGLSDKRKGR